VAYLLKILNQIDLFNSLNWYESMQFKLAKDLENLKGRGTRYGSNTYNYNQISDEQTMEEELS